MKDLSYKIKSVLILGFIVLSPKSQAQTYSTIIKDSDIVSLVTSLGGTLKIHKLDSRVLKWTTDEVFGATGNKIFPHSVGLIAGDSVKKYFTKDDIGFIGAQFNASIQGIWRAKDILTASPSLHLPRHQYNHRTQRRQ